MRRGLLIALLGIGMLVGGVVPSAGALSVNEVAKEVKCPTCTTPLDVSEAPVAQDMKIYIAERIDAGWSKNQIIDGLVAEFGPSVRATPPKSGFDLIAWLVPAIAVGVGLAAIAVLTRLWAIRGRRRRMPAPPTAAEEQRLEDRLREPDPL
jgi:cytochrome c-type biogenesis protein CcmH